MHRVGYELTSLGCEDPRATLKAGEVKSSIDPDTNLERLRGSLQFYWDRFINVICKDKYCRYDDACGRVVW